MTVKMIKKMYPTRSHSRSMEDDIKLPQITPTKSVEIAKSKFHVIRDIDYERKTGI